MITRYKNQIHRDGLATLLIIGLSLLSLGFVVAQWRPEHTLSSYLTLALVMAAGLVVSLGVQRLSYSMRAAEALSVRLNSFEQSAKLETLTPIFEAGAMGRGWNSLVELLGKQQLDQRVERRLADAVGNVSGERFARALRSISDGLVISDRYGRLNYANPAWLSLSGSGGTAEELIGQSLTAHLAENGYRNWEQVSRELLEGTRPVSWELRFGEATTDGVLQLSRLPLEGRMHETEGFVWSLRNITQHTLAQEAHESFLAAATHELRTPLTNIKAYSESLLEMDEIPRAQQQEFFNVIHSEAERLRRLLNQLLDIQQLEAGSMTVDTATFDVQRMLQEVQLHIQPLINEKQLNFTCRIAPDIKTLQADKEKVISCLLNLLGNAIKYTGEGGEINLVAEQQESAVSICVEDTGIGIAEDQLPHVFDRFYRCQDERVTDIEGNGLGLAFAMEVARLHHGELRVESQLNVGSRFILRLPLASNL